MGNSKRSTHALCILKKPAYSIVVISFRVCKRNTPLPGYSPIEKLFTRFVNPEIRSLFSLSP